MVTMISLLAGAPALPPPHPWSRHPIKVFGIVFVIVALIAVLPTGGAMDSGGLCGQQWPRRQWSCQNLLRRR